MVAMSTKLFGLKSLGSRLRGDERGAIGIWMCLAITVILGAGALSVDMGSLYTTRGQLQHAADAAALAAVDALPNEEAATAAALSYARKNMPFLANGDVLVAGDVVSGSWNKESASFSSGATPINAFRVVARRAQENGNAAPTFFARALGRDNVNVSATATAARIEETAACVTTLNPTATGAFQVGGSATVQTYDCAIQVNSCNSAAFKAQGNVVVNIVDSGSGEAKINVCGGADIKGSATLSPSPNTNTGKRLPDPFADTPMPDPALYDQSSDCDQTNFSATGDVDLYPGVYCGGITLTGSGTATFHATGGSLDNGLYIIKDGPLSVAGTMSMVANGVTFFLTGTSANLDFGGTADIGLSAPTTGPLAGFIFVADRNNPPSGPHNLRGTSLGGYNGYIYLPGGEVNVVGTANGTAGSSDCTVIVADTFVNSGTPNFEAKSACADYGTPMIKRTVLVN